MGSGLINDRPRSYLGGGGGSGGSSPPAGSEYVTTIGTLATLKTTTGEEWDVVYCVETETFYRYETEGSGYSADDTYVCAAGDGGDTRWIGVGGRYPNSRQFGTGSGNVAEGNDSRFPTSDQKAALVGTPGTPSASNPYIVGSDANGNVVIGDSAGASLNGEEGAVIIGKNAGDALTDAGDGTIAIGSGALGAATVSPSIIAIGKDALGSFTSDNTAYGSTVAIGEGAMENCSTMIARNVAIGSETGYALHNAQDIVFVGYRAGFRVGGLGGKSTFVGSRAGQEIVGGSNVSVGYRAAKGASASNSGGVAAVGSSAGESLNGESACVLVGYNAGNAITDAGDGTVAIGSGALGACTTSPGNTAVGYNALGSLTSNADGKNTAIGYESGASCTNDNNTFVGHQAGNRLGAGSQNVFLGDRAGYCTSNATAQGCVSIGYQAGYSLDSEKYAILIGAGAGTDLTDAGDGTIAIGRDALKSAVTSPKNVAIGFEAGAASVHATGGNVYIGYQAGKTCDQYQNVYIGSMAGYAVPTGKMRNVVIGAEAAAAPSYSNVYVGYRAGLNITDSTNTAVGCRAARGAANSGSYRIVCMGYDAGLVLDGEYGCVLIGHRAGTSLTDTVSNGTVGVGKNALEYLTTGPKCTAVGRDAGSSITTNGLLTAFGWEAAKNVTGADNVVIGASAAPTLTSGAGNLVIGNGMDTAAADSDNTFVLGGGVSGSYYTLMNGVFASSPQLALGSTAPTTGAGIDLHAASLCMEEMTLPSGVANKAFLAVRDNGGTTELVVVFENNTKVIETDTA